MKVINMSIKIKSYYMYVRLVMNINLPYSLLSTCSFCSLGEIFESFRFIHITIKAAFAYVDVVYLNLHSLGSLVELMKLLGISYTLQSETVQSRKSLECVLKLSDCSIRLLSS